MYHIHPPSLSLVLTIFKERGMKKDRFTCDLDAAVLMTQVDRQFMPQAEITITPYVLVNNHGR
jgi:hypothetical protein